MFCIFFINNSTSVLAAVRRIVAMTTLSASVSLMLAINWTRPRSRNNWHTVDHYLLGSVLDLDLLGMNVLHRVSHLILHITIETRVIRLSVTWELSERSSRS